jgi:hypothetical protein
MFVAGNPYSSAGGAACCSPGEAVERYQAAPSEQDNDPRPEIFSGAREKHLVREGRAPGRRVPADSVKVRLRLSVNTTNTLCGGGAPLPRNPSNAVPTIYV